MPDQLDPRIEILPPAQKEIWPQLAPAPGLGFVLYGGTAVAKNTLVMGVPMPSGPVKISFFGGLTLDRINDPLCTRDQVLLVASLEDLLATKKAILDRAEAKDYRDIAAMLTAGVSLEGIGGLCKELPEGPHASSKGRSGFAPRGAGPGFRRA
ncbi:nucleotidyl transferase AbiEii/AbiGii toxin family protein [Bradyrhizobium sp. WSM 1738]|uniref:nucleotidyl transferase AbiEii/AbiGii toxin family protein n=1 Tax=Bradyrhizobium hereditatis TaxID=2821405 RepID=UPI001CE33E72|nr:nucleotidyl transferase AbiEii/AbiGii toxin family protein [Bradyrhizobium hereditatis]MCA6114494.1 nucleotidyl transferase AbiEii/AbiGii toxin family protein [Bradyrhizobium hereditatis]